MKKKILEQLKNNKGDFVSGEELSSGLGVSRTSIWKYIKSLKEEGYDIESSSRKGYKLIEEPDKFSQEELEIILKDNDFIKKIYYFDTIDSTNKYAKELALKGADEGTLILSDEQRGGRGRLGRNWISPPNTGLWMSIILRPQIKPWEAPQITSIAAAALCKAIENTINIKVGIKWPNDIVVNNKKISGILTEMGAEPDTVNFIVVGIGINVNTEDFPEDIKDIATSLKLIKGDTVSRKRLLINVLQEFKSFYLDFVNNKTLKKSIDICRENSIILGNKVKIINGMEEIIVVALDINDRGELVVKKDNGEIINIISGEVSLRGVSNYI